MKTVRHLLIAAAAMLAAQSYMSEASAQCYSHGYNHFAPKPVVSRFYHFQMEGRAFAFDRVSGDIFCGNVKIGFRTPDGNVSLLPDAAARMAAAPGGAVVPGQGPVGGAGPVAGGQAPGVPAAPAVDGGARRLPRMALLRRHRARPRPRELLLLATATPSRQPRPPRQRLRPAAPSRCWDRVTILQSPPCPRSPRLTRPCCPASGVPRARTSWGAP